MFIVSKMQVGLAGALVLQLLAGTAAFAETQPAASAPVTGAVAGSPSTDGQSPAPSDASGAAAAASAVPKICFLPPAAVPQAEVDAFLKAPDELLTTYPTGGIEAVSKVRGLSGTSYDTVPVLLKVAEKANREQRAAIGAGLARAAMACVAKNPEYAAAIQESIARSGMVDVEAAFLAISGDFATAALGATGSGASATSAPGISGNGQALGGTAGRNGDEFVNTVGYPVNIRAVTAQFFSTASTDVSPVQP